MHPYCSLVQGSDRTQDDVVHGLLSSVQPVAASGIESENNEMQSIENTEATNPSVVPAEGTEAMEGCEVPIKSSEVPTDMAESLDIEAELDKREARSKKFGTSFDRESCRQQLLRVYSTPQVGSMYSTSNNNENNNVGLLHGINA